MKSLSKINFVNWKSEWYQLGSVQAVTQQESVYEDDKERDGQSADDV